MKIRIKELDNHKGLPLPVYQTSGSAGLDLHAAINDNIILPAKKYLSVPTGLILALDEGYEAQIRPRSGLAAKYGITVLNSPGTIDADYRGEVCILLINHSDTEFVIERGMRIAQMVIAKVEQAELIVCDSLNETERGAGGFGHTGI